MVTSFTLYTHLNIINTCIMFQSYGDNLSLTDSLSLGSASVGGHHQHPASDQANLGKHNGQGEFIIFRVSEQYLVIKM